MISRFSSRNERLSHVFLKDRLRGAKSYDRIAGYFHSSIFNLIHEEISGIERVRIVCNADLNQPDLTAAKLSAARAQLEAFTVHTPQAESLLSRDRYRRLYDLLRAGNVEIRAVSRENSPFLHGKAGLITRPDGSTSSFIGSSNDSENGWDHSYELIWEDTSAQAAQWVQQEFDWLWARGVPLDQVVIDEVGRQANKQEIRLSDVRKQPMTLIKASLVESPARLRGENLMPWQKDFVGIWHQHRERHGAARLILADEVGVGKTLSMAAAGALSALLGDGPLLILCPSTLTEQWQVELWDKLGLPSARWTRVPAKGWIDHKGHLVRARSARDILKCPCQIGIVSTGIPTTRRKKAMLPEAEILLEGRFGMVVLDEGHRARVHRSATKDEPKAGNLWSFMEQLAGRTRHMVIGTATPIQTHREEIWDLMKLIAVGQEHVLGRRSMSRWHDDVASLDLISGQTRVETVDEAWEWIRSPLPAREEGQIFRDIRRDLDLPTEPFTAASIADLDSFTRDDFEDAVHKGEVGLNLEFLRYHNPLGRHVVLRRRKALEDAGLMDAVDLKLWPRPEQDAGIFADGAVITPHYYDLAYEAVGNFTQAMAQRVRATGFMKTMLLQRICSSVTAGLSSAMRMIEGRQAMMDDAEDEDLVEMFEALDAAHEHHLLDTEIERLRHVVGLLEGRQQEDPKGRAVLYFLADCGWLDLGSIIFSQYFDTARWIADIVSRHFPEEPVALYAGLGRSGIILDGEWRSVQREEIKALVRNGRVRVLTATDAAGEGLNLQTLGTLINVDLPWNPSRLEQRIGRIKRFGQKRKHVDMASLVYQGTLDEQIYQRLSERMRDRHDVLGSIPDVIEDDWIFNAREIESQWQSYTNPPSPGDLFSLRYGDFLKTMDDDWETFEKVIARDEIMSTLQRPW